MFRFSQIYFVPFIRAVADYPDDVLVHFEKQSFLFSESVKFVVCEIIADFLLAFAAEGIEEVARFPRSYAYGKAQIVFVQIEDVVIFFKRYISFIFK